MLAFVDKIPLLYLVAGAVLLGLAPFAPEPHLFEKLRMLGGGVLTRPMDIFDLLMHAALPALLAVRLVRMMLKNR